MSPMNNDRHVLRHDPSRNAGSGMLAEFEGLSLARLRLAAGEVLEETTGTETAWLLMKGRVRGRIADRELALERQSLFDESASCIHASANTRLRLAAETDTELTVYRCGNGNAFPPRVFLPGDVPNERRGEGQVANRCLRFVRTVFDGRNSPAGAELVLGEVVTLPGGWSSYPPHHHRQPEIYHYRFSEAQGFGHAELGDDVYKVRHGDTICIPPGLDHAQCTAPGYGMYYSWVIRHLPGDPYTVPDFTKEHAWTMDDKARYWWPDDVAK